MCRTEQEGLVWEVMEAKYWERQLEFREGCFKGYVEPYYSRNSLESMRVTLVMTPTNGDYRA